MRRHFVLAIVGLFVLGCASGAAVAPETEQVAKQFGSIPGKGQLYIVRPAGAGVAVFYQVKLDGRAIGSLVPGSFLVQPLDPGLHQVILTNPTAEIPVSVTVEAGKNYYLRVAFSTTAAPGERTGLVPEDEGRALVLASKMAVSTGK